MSDIRVVVDSSASLPRAIADELGITIVPMQIQCGSESYREDVDLSQDDFYRRLTGTEVLTTSQPTPGSFVEAYQRLVRDARTILSLHVSSRASGTCNCASLASREFPNADIEVVDSLSVSMGLGLLAIVSARMAALDKRKDEILRTLNSLRSRLEMFAVVPTLTYLQRSGRVSLAASVLGSVLSIKPIITMRDGVVHVVERVRTLPRAVERLLALAQDAAGAGRCLVAVIHANARAAADDLAAEVQRRLNPQELIVAEMGSCLAVHGGPGMLGIITCPAPDSSAS